jgi:hypothetical protein
MKRFLALLCIFCLLLCGCGQTAPTTSPFLNTQPGTTGNIPTTAPVIGSPDQVECDGHASDPYLHVDKAAFYENYTPACCYVDACYRTAHFLLSGRLEVPGQYATIASDQPAENGMLLRNTDRLYLDDGNTYVVMDACGKEVLRIYKGAAYITLEEVAAYMFAFGGSDCQLPANYTSKKVKSVGTSPWGIYLRGNHSYFSGNTEKYPYEPVLPDISGCGGTLSYFEMDIGTTGTTTPGYSPKPYNNGTSIERGAARLVYARQDKNRNGIIEENEVFVFYTANHYNDFREYLNYFGGWGEIFGNETGGGAYSSKTDYNPTPYIPTGYASFRGLSD